MTSIDVEALKRFLDSELYSRLEDFYLRQPHTLRLEEPVGNKPSIFNGSTP